MDKLEEMVINRSALDYKMKEKLLDYDISTMSWVIQDLHQNENFLLKEIDRHKEILDNLKDEQERYKEDIDPNTKMLTEDMIKGQGFFTQLRFYEAEYERLEGELKGNQSVLRSLIRNVKTAKSQQNQLIYKINELKANLVDVNSTRKMYNSKFTGLQQQIIEYDEKILELTGICEKIKEDVKQKSLELQRFSPNDQMKLIDNKIEIEKRLKERQQALKSLKNEEKKQRSNIIVNRRKRTQQLQKEVTPTKWLSERSALVAKIKSAKEELAGLKNRNRGLAKLTTKTNQCESEMNYSDTEAMAAILREMQTFKYGASDFIIETFETEQTYNGQLQNELIRLEKTYNEITNFKSATMEFYTKQETKIVSRNMQEILTEELNELRAQLSQ